MDIKGINSAFEKELLQNAKNKNKAKSYNNKN